MNDTVFKEIFSRQLSNHPSMRAQDVIKLCYQAAYGAEHLLSNRSAAWDYFKTELEGVPEKEETLYEQISEDVVRVNLSAWKKKGFPGEWLFNMFVSSCKVNSNGAALFEGYLESATAVIEKSKTEFTAEEWKNALSEYRKSGATAVHHSSEYRLNEKPSYRIVNSGFVKAFPVLEKIKECLREKEQLVVAIDGRASSGKTTLAECLRIAICADVIHMDDFFVPPKLRTAERFEKPGGNIHYERFLKEVLPVLSKNEPFSYGIFDCGAADFVGERKIGNSPVRIVEGAYSCHPVFGDYADITVFSDVPKEEQIKRIRKRNGEKMLEIFRTKWIPLEEEYFSYYSIEEKADMKV